MKLWVTLLTLLAWSAGLGSPAAALTVYVSNEKDNSISVIDADKMEVTATIPVGQRPRGITLSKDQSKLFIYEARELPGPLPELRHIPEGASVYVTIDIDGIDPAFAPGVSHPVPGGLTARQVLDFLGRGHWNLIGMDVVEVSPPRDIQSQTAILGARLLHEGMGYAASRWSELESNS